MRKKKSKLRLAVCQGIYSISLLRNLVVLRARVVFTIFALKWSNTNAQLSLSIFDNCALWKSMISPCKVKSIIDNLSPVDHWNILKSEQELISEIEFWDGWSFSNTADVLLHNFQLQVLYLMLGAQLGEETLPVFRVVVDSIEACHIYVGHQPIFNIKNHVLVCSCLDRVEKLMHVITLCSLPLHCSQCAPEINLTFFANKPE